MKEEQPTAITAAWLAEWIDRPAETPPHRSIVLGSKCAADLKSIGSQIAIYLNQFDEQAEGHWRAFTHRDLYEIAGNPTTREMILNPAEPDPHPGPPDSDLDRVARRIARLGNAILEGQYSLDATNELESTFRVCLCGNHPPCIEPCNMWLNPTTFTHGSLVSVIADSFLDWSSKGEGLHLSSPSAGNTPHPADGAEPDGRRCASL
jgi:hypothetical protein